MDWEQHVINGVSKVANLSLQDWDNILSMGSSAVTIGGIAFGVIFGKKKVNEWLVQKNRDSAHNTIVEFIAALDKYCEVLAMCQNTMAETQTPSRFSTQLNVDINKLKHRSDLLDSYYTALLIKADTLLFWNVKFSEQGDVLWDELNGKHDQINNIMISIGTPTSANFPEKILEMVVLSSVATDNIEKIKKLGFNMFDFAPD